MSRGLTRGTGCIVTGQVTAMAVSHRWGQAVEPTDSVRSKQIVECSLMLSLLESSQAKDELKYLDMAAIFVTILNAVFSGLTPCSLVNIWCVGGTYILRLLNIFL
jgi:hypothetical protein